ncbi:MAG: Calx-beta domain-containing protein, partial [Candidatus Eutrophobiaceae bacterium]
MTVKSDVAIAATAPAIGFTLTFASRGDRGVEGADFGGDYSDLTQPLPAVAFSGDGGTTATVTVATVDDNFYEGSEGYTVGLSAPTGDAALGSEISEDGTLSDNDEPVLSLTAATTAAEGGAVSLTIKSSKPFASETAWDVIVAFSGAGIAAGDFAGFTLTHTVKAVFAAGADTATVTIATANDNVYEGD